MMASSTAAVKGGIDEGVAVGRQQQDGSEGGARQAALSTKMLHVDAPLVAGGAVAAPISVTTTWAVDPAEVGARDEPYVYSRGGTPVRDRAEALVGELEGGQAVLYSSGQAALWAALVYFNPSRIALDGGYHGSVAGIALHANKYGTQVLGLDEPLGKGDLVWLETPKNPCCEVVDVRQWVVRCAAAGATLCVDSTFAPPPLQRLLPLGADCVMHSTTKYLAGHSDALGGALVVRDPAAATKLRNERLLLGSVPGSLEAWLLLRSLRTLPLRVTQQSRSAAALVRWLSSGDAPHVTKVHHPSLPTCPGHAAAIEQMTGGFGAMLSFEVDSEELAKAVPQRAKLFTDATSLGGVESLMEWRRKHDATQPVGLLRVSVGLEDPDDLIADIYQALVSCDT